MDLLKYITFVKICRTKPGKKVSREIEVFLSMLRSQCYGDRRGAVTGKNVNVCYIRQKECMKYASSPDFVLSVSTMIIFTITRNLITTTF